MRPFSHQKTIAKAFGNDRELVLSKSELIERTGISYYHNTRKHFGDVVGRMIANGLLVRVRRGFYKLGALKPSYPQKPYFDSENQLKLF